MEHYSVKRINAILAMLHGEISVVYKQWTMYDLTSGEKYPDYVKLLHNGFNEWWVEAWLFTSIQMIAYIYANEKHDAITISEKNSEINIKLPNIGFTIEFAGFVTGDPRIVFKNLYVNIDDTDECLVSDNDDTNKAYRKIIDYLQTAHDEHNELYHKQPLAEQMTNFTFTPKRLYEMYKLVFCEDPVDYDDGILYMTLSQAKFYMELLFHNFINKYFKDDKGEYIGW